MNKMFFNCENLTELNLCSLDTGNVIDFSEMFSGCQNLININIKSFKTKNAINLSKMFKGCINLKKIEFPCLFEIIKVNDMSEMFSNCYSLSYLNVNFSKNNNLKTLREMFYKCENLKSISNLDFNTGKLADISLLFYGCSSLVYLPDISNWNTSNIKNMPYIFGGCSSLNSIPDISKWNTNNITKICGIFNDCTALKSIPDISKWNLNKVNNISFMFYGCLALKELPDISKWNTNKVINMSFMFSKCFSLISLPDLSKFVTNKVINMSHMFYGCSSLESFNGIQNWNTENVINFSYMFYDCYSISEFPDISKWNISKAKDISYMFYGCLSLKNISAISKWDMEKVTNYEKFIAHCPSLEEYPDLSKSKIKHYYLSHLDFNLFEDDEIPNEEFELNCEIKDDNIKYIPQIEIKFNNIEKIDKDIISKLKLELSGLIKNKNFSIIEIRKGSLTVLLTLQYIIQSEIEREKELNNHKLSEEFDIRVKNDVERIKMKLCNHEFICLGTAKPDYCEKHIISITDETSRKTLNEKIIAVEDDNEINIYEASKNISIEDINQFIQYISLKAENLEQNQSRIIQRLEEYNNVFDVEIEKALTNSIFEYKIIHIFIVDKDDSIYKQEKMKCKNRQVKYLFHGTKVDSITSILSSQFRDANKFHIFGIGVYFTDMLDYAWYYAGEKERQNFGKIPKVGETFSVVVSEIYYNKSKLEKVYDNRKIDMKVETNGIRCVNVNWKSKAIKKKNLSHHKGFIGNEFLVTNKNQILPLYCITFKRVEYLVIWRDYNFNTKNPNSYDNKTFNNMQIFHKKIKNILANELNCKIYYLNNSEEALNLIDLKKYNKIIIITNSNNNAEDFIYKGRQLIGSDTIVGISTYNTGKNYKMIQKIHNAFLLNGLDFHKKFFYNAINNDVKSLINLKDEINNYYSSKLEDFNLANIDDTLLKFPNFKNDGLFEALTFDRKK